MSMKSGNGIWSSSFAIAHRGASQLAPENTIAALMVAKAKGAAWVECDVQLTRDDVPVILHDTTLNRTTNTWGLLSATSFQKIQTLDAGSWFSTEFSHEPVPTLTDWLTACVKLKIGLNLEMKARSEKRAQRLAKMVAQTIQQCWTTDFSNLVISSANITCLTEIAKYYPSIKLGLIYSRHVSERVIQQLRIQHIISVHQPFSVFDAAYVAWLHSQKMFALAYTVNDPALADQLKQMRVDGIFTDNVALFQ